MPRGYKSKAMAAIHETMRDLHRAGSIDGSRMRQYDDMCLIPGQPGKQPTTKTPSKLRRPPVMTFQVLKDSDNCWRWQLIAADGKLIASSGEAYKSKKSCMAAIELVKTSADADVAA